MIWLLGMLSILGSAIAIAAVAIAAGRFAHLQDVDNDGRGTR